MRSSLRSLESVEPEMITEIDAPNFGIGAELFGATFPEYFPTFQDVCVIGYAKSFADVMIGNQHANPRLSQIPDNFLEEIIRDLAKSGIGVLITDHNVRETLSVTDHAYILKSGKIFRKGRPEELSADPEVRRVYLGDHFRLN